MRITSLREHPYRTVGVLIVFYDLVMKRVTQSRMLLRRDVQIVGTKE